jgi:hypothetical protein
VLGEKRESRINVRIWVATSLDLADASPDRTRMMEVNLHTYSVNTGRK